MKTLSDLTLKQLTAIFGTVSGRIVGPRFFNGRAAGIHRVEALLAEKGLTVADALRAVRIEDEVEPTASEPEAVAEEPMTEPPLEGEAAPVPETLVPLDAATILIADTVQADIRDLLLNYLTDSAGLDAETAVLAARRAVAALRLAELTASHRLRTASKQEQLIDLLRRPEGATLAQMVEATGWLPHSCRGVLAGVLKKRLGLTVTSSKESSEPRVYRIS